MYIRTFGRKLAVFCGVVLSLIVLFSPQVYGQPTHTRVIYAHNLLNTTPVIGETIVNSGGNFIAGRGWKSTLESSQLTITLPSTLPSEGTAVFDVTNFDPVSQNTYENKQHIFNLYSRVYPNNKDIFYTDGSWCNIRTGAAYSTGPGVAGFKFLAAARGLGTRDEERCVESNTWDLNRTYQFKIIWTTTYTYCYLDGVLMSRLPFSGQVEMFKYILIGRDNLIWGYSAQPGVIFTNLKIYGPGTPVIQLSSKLFLEGAYQVASHNMRTLANTGASLPLQSPYALAPYTAASIPSNIVDWIMVSLRSTATGTPVQRRSLWLRQDGRVIDPVTQSEISTWSLASGNYYVTVQHRNHLAAQSATSFSFNGLTAAVCDLSLGLDRLYNGRGARQVESGVWALQSGELNADGLVNTTDFNLWQTSARSGSSGYSSTDLNHDGYCTTRDYVLWYENARIAAQSGMP